MLTLLNQDGEDGVVHQGESCNITGQLRFGDTEIAKAVLDTLTLTLYDQATQTVINNRNAQDILDANNSSVDATCNVTIELDAADNPIVNANREAGFREKHVALVTWGWNDGNTDRIGRELLEFWVEQVATPS